jgi:hypothetical protein
MIRNAFVQSGERTELLPKGLTYAFSLDFALRLGRLGNKPPGALVLESLDAPTFHVADRDFVTLADGSVRDVPKARLKRANDFLPLARDVVTLNGRLLFETDTPNPLVMTYSGVLNVPGDTEDWCRAGHEPTTAFVYSRQDYLGAKYRWTVQNQLIGVADVRPELKSSQNPECLLKFAFDFYVAA